MHQDVEDDACPAGSPENCPIDRRRDDPWRGEVTARMDTFEQKLAENTEKADVNLELTKEIKANTDDIVAFFEAGKGFFQVVRVVGTVAKWVTTVAAAFVVMWFVFKVGVNDAITAIKEGNGK